MLNITYERSEHPNFTEWRFDLLRELAEIIHFGPTPGRTQQLDLEKVRIWYEPNEDFHMLEFKHKDDNVLVRFYKVFAYSVNRVDEGVRCREEGVHGFALGIRKKLGVVVPPAPPEE
jgi:hypothetical protein